MSKGPTNPSCTSLKYRYSGGIGTSTETTYNYGNVWALIMGYNRSTLYVKTEEVGLWLTTRIMTFPEEWI